MKRNDHDKKRALARIRAELAIRGETPAWLAGQIGVDVKHIYRMFGGQISAQHLAAMLYRLDIID